MSALVPQHPINIPQNYRMPGSLMVHYQWIEVKDPQGSQLTYWWNTETHETTALGSPRPYHWVAVRDPSVPPSAPAMIYWWNPETNETTALGSPRPPLFAMPNRAVPVNRTDVPVSSLTVVRNYAILVCTVYVSATIISKIF